MSIDNNVQTVARYADWKILPSEVVKDNIRTVNRESNRQPDPWYFLVGREGLFDVKRQRYVKNVVAEFPHPNPYLRAVEDKIIEDLDDWSNFGDTGFAVWFSPSYGGAYDSNKIEIIQKAYTFGDMKPATMNVCVLFDCTPEVVLKIAREVFPELQEIHSVEELRSLLITKPDLDIERIMEIIKPYIPKVDNYKPVSEENLNYLATLARIGASQQFIALEMKRLGAIGQHSFSCNKSEGGLASTLEANSETLDMRDDGLGPREFPCPECKHINKRPYGGYVHTCQNPKCPRPEAVRC
jgi:hypothetical protein